MPDTRVRKFQCKGLALAWEGVDFLRARVREHGKLILHPKSQKVAACTIKNALLNQDVLIPAMVRLRNSKGKMPLIDELIPECSALYVKMNREVEANTDSKDGWSIRRMLSWLKRKAKRGEFGKDPACRFFLEVQGSLAKLVKRRCLEEFKEYTDPNHIIQAESIAVWHAGPLVSRAAADLRSFPAGDLLIVMLVVGDLSWTNMFAMQFRSPY